jgi:hypothetical protein
MKKWMWVLTAVASGQFTNGGPHEVVHTGLPAAGWPQQPPLRGFIPFSFTGTLETSNGPLFQARRQR